jgi:hypothetical protein
MCGSDLVSELHLVASEIIANEYTNNVPSLHPAACHIRRWHDMHRAYLREDLLMATIDRNYLLVALLLALAGMVLGLYMGLAADTTLLSVHVAFLLPGFVTLAVYGFVFRLWPALKKAPLAQAQFWTGVVGSLLLIVGAYFYATSRSVPLAALGSVVSILASALMAWLFWQHAGET